MLASKLWDRALDSFVGIGMEKETTHIVPVIQTKKAFWPHWMIFSGYLEPSKLHAVLVCPRSCWAICNGCVFDRISAIILWSNIRDGGMHLDCLELVIKIFALNLWDQITEACSIAVLNAFDKNISKEECKVASMHIWRSSHQAHYIFLRAIVGKRIINLIKDVLNSLGTILTALKCGSINLLIELPEVFNWVYDSWWRPWSDSHLRVLFSEPCW